MQVRRRQFLGAMGAAVCCSALPIRQLQAKASPPLRMLVGFAPGGAADLVARFDCGPWARSFAASGGRREPQHSDRHCCHKFRPPDIA